MSARESGDCLTHQTVLCAILPTHDCRWPVEDLNLNGDTDD